jgi:hypothetical protein
MSSLTPAARCFALLLLVLGNFAPKPARAENVPAGPWNDSPASALVAQRLPPLRLLPPSDRPNLAPREHARRSAELGFEAGVAHKLCPAGLDRCDNEPGKSFGLRVAARPSPYFAYGVNFDDSSWSEALSAGGLQLDIAARRTSLGVLGRVLPFGAGALDPYIEFAAGGGRAEDRGTLANATESITVQEVALAPWLRASAGLDLQVHSHLKFGAHFHWTHWLLTPRERCAGVAFGACTLPSPGHFDVNNAAWSLSFGVTLLFGSLH